MLFYFFYHTNEVFSISIHSLFVFNEVIPFEFLSNAIAN